MHSTFIPMDNPHLGLHGMPQEVVFPTDLPSNDPNYEHRGKPKGLRQVLEERDVLQPGTSSTCCMRKCLSEQADFKAEKPLLQITIEAAGHRCYFLLKFHCELNPIEMYWGWTKTHKEILFSNSCYHSHALI
ncbi:hypothetical protein K439DRAFT_1336608 [Ramaria rubella]|nr:hypothetical protein K439DRAFT_1336608 [Ramaria rubella]